MNANYRNLAIWGVIALLLFVLFSLFQTPAKVPAGTDIAYSAFLKQVEQGRVARVVISGRRVLGSYQDGIAFETYTAEDPNLVERLRAANVTIVAKPESEETGSFLGLLLSWFPAILMIGIWLFLIRQMQGSGGRAMGFGKSKAKLLTENQEKIVFSDVAGVDEAKADLEEIVEFLRAPAKFEELGGEIPRGVLLIGPPGTGKTLLARAVAGEADVPFFSISGSDFVEMFVGVGASRVRDMFEQARKNSPCIVFIDEIDAVGRHRGAGLGGGNDEREQTLNQLLVEMDGFESSENVILLAATNRPDVLDPALLRPGRFDRQIVVSNPDVRGREKILDVHVGKVKLASDVDLKTIARGTPGFSGADLMNLVNEAALLAARRNKRLVTMSEFEDAKDKVMMGSERRSLVMTEDEKRLTAYHEGGHAVIALSVPATDPVHKVTVIPRGRALGMVMQLPERDQLSMSFEQMKSRLTVLMGGRVAEELIFGSDKVTSGAASDIEQATRLARMMVTRWGFSETLGSVMYGENQEEVFLGHSVARHQSISETTAQEIDKEVRRLVDEAQQRSQEILSRRRVDLELVAQALLEHETLSGEDLKNLLDGKPILRNDASKGQARREPIVPAAGKRRTGDQKSAEDDADAADGLSPLPQA